MKKPIIKNTVKIILGYVLCNLISGLANLFTGIFLANKSSIEESKEILDSILVSYLGFIIPLIILGLLIVMDFLKDKKENVLWKVILIVLFYLTFEFNIISKLLA